MARKDKELEFKEALKRGISKKLREKLGNKYNEYEIKIRENLIYKVVINENLQFEPNSPHDPRRGDYAFQTDLLIGRKIGREKDKILPLVVIEAKFVDFTTHDVLTYSSKAQKHKEIYPYLRYGLVVGRKVKRKEKKRKNVIQNKFFTHNIGFDFACAVAVVSKKIDENSLNELVDIIEVQIKNAEEILKIFNNRNRASQTTSFNTQITINKLKENNRGRQGK